MQKKIFVVKGMNKLFSNYKINSTCIFTVRISFVLPLVIGAVVKHKYNLPFLMSCGLILNLYSAVLVKYAPDKISIWKLFFVIFQLLCLGLAY
jgi:hypothetical protein